jgi:hypothetical protein
MRLLLLPVLAWAGFVAYGYSLEFFGEVITVPSERPLVYGALLAQGFLAAAMISVLFCYPIALVYRSSAVTAALVVALPVLVLRLPELVAFDRHAFALVISAYEVLSYAALLVIGAWLAHRRTTRNSTAQHSTAQHAKPH